MFRVLFLFLLVCADCFSSDYCLVILTDSRKLDYTNNHGFFKSLAKHPSDWSKNGDVGHAWVYLEGILNDQRVAVEGGHSGELGMVQPKYFDGIMDAIERGEKNPIKYLWEAQKDGFFQSGAGNHKPTFAAKVELTAQQFQQIMSYMNLYPYQEYAITGNQCTSYVAQIAALAGLNLNCDVTMKVEQGVQVAGEYLTLWQDPQYSTITFATPDLLEQSLRVYAKEGKVKNVLNWYLKTHAKPICCRIKQARKVVQAFPKRFWRYVKL